MIYILATSNLIPGKMAEYIANGEARLQSRQKVGMKLVGEWRGYSGDTNRTYSLYAYNDLAEFQRMHDARDKDAEFQQRSAMTQALIKDQSWVFIRPFDWWPVKLDGKAPFCLLATNDVIPGKMAEYEAIRKELTPIMQKVGMNMVGIWRGYSGNPNRVNALYAYNDATEYHRIRAGRANDPDFRKGTDRMQSLLADQSSTFIEPFVWSPMR